MTLRRKILLIIGATLVALILGLYKVSSSILLADFSRLERCDVVRDVTWSKSALANELADLGERAGDWAAREDTSQFVQDHNRNYVRANLEDSTFADLRLNFIVCLNGDGQVEWSGGFDLREAKRMPVPDSLLRLLKGRNALVQHANDGRTHSGLILLPEGITLVASRSIGTGQSGAPSRGTVLVGRYLDTAAVKRFTDAAHLMLMIHRADDPALPADFREALARESDPNGVFVQSLTGDWIGGYVVCKDIFGKPAAVLRVEKPRDILAQGLGTARLLVVSLLVIGLCFGVAMAVLFERLVLARLARMIREVNQIGRRNDVAARMVIDGKDELAGLAGALNQMLDALQQSQARLQESIQQQQLAADRLRLQGAALDSAANAIVLTDREGTVEWVNPAFTRLTGYALADVYGERWSALKADGHDPASYDKLWKTILSGEVWQGELVSSRKDGTRYTARMTIAPVADEDGRVAHFIAIKEDMTEQKTLQEQFLQAQKVEAVGRLAGGVAHDFNNILTAITGYTELLLRKLPADDARFRLAEQIRKAAERASGLTRQLLAFSRKQALQPRIVDLSNIVTDMEKMLRRLIGEDIELHTIRGAAVGNVRADPAQIEQVLMNLAVNARDAMPNGGKLVIEVARATLRDDRARLSGMAPGEYVMLSVTDTGSGMTEEVKAHIFEPFFTTKRQGNGTGLGLATCYGIVKQSGGSIEVDTEVGRGTTFRIYLPRVDATADSQSERPKTAPWATGTETILVAEDEADVRKLAAGILRELGYHVIEASNGEEGIRVAEQNAGAKIDLLFTDIVMPQMDGKQLADWFGTTRPETKVLFTSGYTADAMIRRGIYEDQISFVEKPFTPEILARRVREVLDGRESEAVRGPRTES
ncbi:MAG TPA: CHASE4 domain-containing protein [Verrucomicrobiae bacterium]|nr:CHASE4 domain-containing protein [Verrucomicrobiae bacterium]